MSSGSLTASSSTGSRDISEEWDALLFGVRRSTRYHNRRREHFDAWNRRIAILTTFSGVGTVTSLLGKAGETITLVFASVVSFLSIVDLVAKTSDSARAHYDLAKRFLAVEREMVRISSPTEADLQTFSVRRLEIEADEPPPLRVLDVICHNELIRAMNYDEADLRRVGRWQRLCSNYFDFLPHDLKRISEASKK